MMATDLQFTNEMQNHIRADFCMSLHTKHHSRLYTPRYKKACVRVFLFFLTM